MANRTIFLGFYMVWRLSLGLYPIVTTSAAVFLAQDLVVINPYHRLPLDGVMAGSTKIVSFNRDMFWILSWNGQMRAIVTSYAFSRHFIVIDR